MAGRTPAVIAVVDTFKYRNADAVIVRRAAQEPHDVIIVRRNKATADRLAEAVHVLEVERARFGSVPSRDELIRVREPGPKNKHPGESEDWAEILRKVKPADLPGFGRVSHIGVMLRDGAVEVRPSTAPRGR